jgi:hypothetical protein
VAYKLPALTTPAERFRASKIRESLFITEAQEREAAPRFDADGGVTVSFVKIVEEQQAARRRAGRRAA